MSDPEFAQRYGEDHPAGLVTAQTQQRGGPRVTAKFRLFVAGETARSLRAAGHIRQLCREAVGEDYELEIVDVLERPDLADEARILATPTVIKQAPLPLRRVIGDLSDLERLATALDLELPEPLTRGDRS